MFPIAGIFDQEVVLKHGIDILASKGILRIKGQRIPILIWKKEGVLYASSDSPPTESVRPAACLTNECAIAPISDTMAFARVNHLVPTLRGGVVEMREIGTHGLVRADVTVRNSYQR